MQNEAVQIEQIRYELTWRIRHEVMYPNLPFGSIKLTTDPEGIHFGLYTDDALTTVASLFYVNKIYQFRKLATLIDQQGKGYGSMMVQYLINFVINEKAETLWCNARVSVASFYSKFGFKARGPYFRENEIEFVIMELDLTGTLDA